MRTATPPTRGGEAKATQQNNGFNVVGQRVMAGLSP